MIAPMDPDCGLRRTDGILLGVLPDVKGVVVREQNGRVLPVDHLLVLLLEQLAPIGVKPGSRHRLGSVLEAVFVHVAQGHDVLAAQT